MPTRKAVGGLVTQARGATGAARPSLSGVSTKWLLDLLAYGVLPPASALSTVSGAVSDAISASSVAMAAIAGSPEHVAAFYRQAWVSPDLTGSPQNGYVATASGVYGSYQPWGGFNPEITNVNNKVWFTSGQYNQWLALEFPARKLVQSVEWTSISHGGADSTARPKSYRIEASQDEVSWVDISGPQATTSNASGVTVALDLTDTLARHVRFFCVESHVAYTGIGYMKIIGKGAS